MHVLVDCFVLYFSDVALMLLLVHSPYQCIDHLFVADQVAMGDCEVFSKRLDLLSRRNSEMFPQ